MNSLLNLFCIILCPIFLCAQTIEKFSIDAGGQSFNNSNISVLYTMGEVFVKEINFDNFQLSAGFINPNTENGTLSQGSVNELDRFSIYPNPATDVFNVSSLNYISKIEVFSLKGEKLITQIEGKSINCTHLASGVYLIKISFEGRSALRKLIIN